MTKKYIRLIVNVPVNHADAVREALGKAGAGQIGSYGFCSFSIKGIGRYIPFKGAHPAIGEVGHLESVEEEQIETFCDEAILESVIRELKAAHPYEEPAITLHPIEIV